MINPCCPAHHYPEYYPILSHSQVSSGYFFLSLQSFLSLLLLCDIFLHMLQQMIMRKDSCCLCKHDHPFSYAFPIVICFRVLPLFKRERCAKMKNFKGGTSWFFFTPVHSACISHSKLLLVAFFSIKMPYAILHKVSFHSPSHMFFTD